ncbi:MAG: peptidylprolyl isomerase [Phycisphaeraceae bacterium]|nr:peptidylprolyl isomerase [Phycisphaeraceae bacterium]
MHLLQKTAPPLVAGLIALASQFVTTSTYAQLTPIRAYYGVDRSIPIEVRVPEGLEGTPTIILLEPVTATIVASSIVEPGRVDLAAHFPILWRSPTPRLLYAQLTIGLEKVGPALVLRPLVEPKPAMLLNPANNAPWFMDPRTSKPSFDGRNGVITFGPAEETAFTGLRIEAEQIAVVRTTLGEIRFVMRPDAAPNTVQNFLDLVRGGFYTDIEIHRIVPVRADGTPFVVQFGDPTASGNGGPGYSIDLERSILPHDLGVLSMARATEPNTAGSQVFICLSREGTKHLDGRYASFAEAVSGAEVIRAIASVPVNAEGRPADPPRVTSITLENAPPYGTGPKPISWRETPEGVR